MKGRTIAAIAVGTVAILGLAAVGTTSLAHGPGEGRWGGMMRGGMGMHGGMMGGGDMGMHRGMMGRGHGHGARMFRMLDTDGDGAVGAEEARAALKEQLETYDADKDGTLSLEEFSALHAAHIRPHMVDRFQFLDEDGDGKVTEEEITTPFETMIRWMDRNGDGVISRDDMRGGGEGRRRGGMMHHE